jgi:hypothetical protein
MATYVPFNEEVFLKAFSGAVCGLLGQSTPLTTVRGSYTDTINIAGAWAKEVDTQWGVINNPDEFESDTIYDFSNDLFEVYEPQPDTGATGIGSSTNPATYLQSANALLAVLIDGETYLAAQGIVPFPVSTFNKGWLNDQVTTNGQGDGGPTTVALVQAVARGSGVFRFAVAGVQAAAAATEVVTWAASYEAGSGAVTTTGGTTTALGNKGSGVALYASAGAGTGIVVTAGGGSDEVLESSAETLGTLYVGSKFSTSGLFWDNVNGKPFAAGTNVIIKLKITNSATNRVVSGMNVSLEEV